MFALVDCNNFYVSCERLFDPGLRGKPVIVLSNNDGCAISRSDEAKAIGIQMGTPPHLIKDLIHKYDVRMFSSNYTLYGDISDRVMQTLSSMVPAIEVYSIDEAFLDLSSMPYCDLLELGMTIRKTVMKNTGIPVCVGIAPTKALAKMANRYAKKKNKEIGVHWAANKELVDEMLEFTAVAHVWGIGRQHALLLNRNGIETAKQFASAPPDFVRRNMSVLGLRLQQELNAVSAFAWDEGTTPKKNICTGRSFAKLTTDKAILVEALSNFAATCAAKLREQDSVARELKVAINTNPHRLQDPQYYRSIVIGMNPATQQTSTLIKYALRGLDIIFNEGYKYMKCSVEARDLVSANVVQANLFETTSSVQNKKLLAVVDAVNKKIGKDSVKLSVQGFEKKYRARAAHLSRKFTTKLEDILRVK